MVSPAITPVKVSEYIRCFSATTEYEEARTNDYYEPWVSYTKESQEIHYNKPKQTND